MTNVFQLTRTALASAVAVTALGLATAATADDKNTQIGMLECTVEGGVGLLLGSKKDMTCTFERKDGGTEKYTGRVTKIGVDIGVTKESHIKWAVLAPSGKADAGALAGKYDGVTAEATVAGGVGANALFSVGNNLTLQPFSVQDQKGLNIAGGLAQIKLDYVTE
ncbi:DUF992 domain-containing protein [Sedimentitalea nanhaiensis]|uniref:DUF992 domain-containing protein n=1 Tax=Sedimentitalea nanhaiensis TaxID=999627 RepID=A0A1I6YIL6_9RHOB|nr:DUF992 domain-containing protein [Sedimentitalea nanhaiensis]SFT50336.1 Protein of unknown function [Sedimentitalea nanhaiensis]